MRKYFWHIFCAGAICTYLSGCTVKDEAASEAASDSMNYEYLYLTDTEITIPAGLVGTEISDSNVVSVNESSGNITYSLSGRERTDIVNNIADEIKESIDTILSDQDYYPNVVSITPNSDYTEFTLSLADGQMNTYEAMLAMSFYTIGNKYQIYSGTAVEDAVTTVIYVNAATGDVISKTDSTSMNTQ